MTSRGDLVQLLRHRRNEPQAFLYAFDLLELNGGPAREPTKVRKATGPASFAKPTRCAPQRTPEHPEGAFVFQHACKMGLEGIVETGRDRVIVGRSPDWLKFKNPQAPAVRREAEEDWGR